MVLKIDVLEPILSDRCYFLPGCNLKKKIKPNCFFFFSFKFVKLGTINWFYHWKG